MARTCKFGIMWSGVGVYATGNCSAFLAFLRSGMPQLYKWDSAGCNAVVSEAKSRRYGYIEQDRLPWLMQSMNCKVEVEGGVILWGNSKVSLELYSNTGNPIYSDFLLLPMSGVSLGGINGVGRLEWCNLGAGIYRVIFDMLIRGYGGRPSSEGPFPPMVHGV